MTVVVLGWDGLDPELIDRYGVAESFGHHQRDLETIVNSTLGKPHTYELWPTMFTGQTPDQHGVHAEAYTEGGAWDSTILNLLTVLSRPIPDALRKRVGSIIRDQGASIQHRNLESYEWTVFDGCDSVALALPNGRSSADDHLGIVSDRGGQLADYIEQANDEAGGARRSTVPQSVLVQRLESEMSSKIGAVQASIRFDPDIVWIWLGYLDTMGHVAPTVDDSKLWMRDAYAVAANATESVRATLTDEDTLLCVSDHGLKEGAHTTPACLATDHSELVQRVQHVTDLASAIADIIQPEKTNSDRYSGFQSKQSVEDTEDQLESLGYL